MILVNIFIRLHKNKHLEGGKIKKKKSNNKNNVTNSNVKVPNNQTAVVNSNVNVPNNQTNVTNSNVNVPNNQTAVVNSNGNQISTEQATLDKRGIITEEQPLLNPVIEEIKKENLGILIPKNDSKPLVLSPIVITKTSLTEEVSNVTSTLTNTALSIDIMNIITSNDISSVFNIVIGTIPTLINEFVTNFVSDVMKSSGLDKTELDILKTKLNTLKTNLPTILNNYTTKVNENIKNKLSFITSIIDTLNSKSKTVTGGVSKDKGFRRTVIIGSIKLIVNKDKMMKIYTTIEEILSLNYLFGLLGNYIDLKYIDSKLKQFKLNTEQEIAKIFNDDLLAFPPSSYYAVATNQTNPNVGKRYIIPNFIKILIGYVKYLLSSLISLMESLFNPNKLKLSLLNSTQPSITSSTKLLLNINENDYNVKVVQ